VADGTHIEATGTPPHVARCRTPGCYARQRHASGKCQAHRGRRYPRPRPRLCIRGCGVRVQCAECNLLGEGFRCRVCAPMRVCLACREEQSVTARGRRALYTKGPLDSERQPALAHVRRDEAADAIGRGA
jgi:hypothetical protein